MLKKINGSTRLVGILGHPVAHTASPAMHNAAFERLGLNWRYAAFDVAPERLREAVRGLCAAGLAGLNVTVPHKAAVLPLLDEVDAEARRLGAVNTIVFRNGKARGSNTDVPGLLEALREAFHFHPRGRTVAIAGCGGAGRAAALGIALAGASALILLNRTRSRAREVASAIARLRLKKKPRIVFRAEPCDLLLQATSLGLDPRDPSPLSEDTLEALAPRRVLEMIYRPAETALMRLARRKGAHVANGSGMLLHQGARAFEIWTGRRAPIEAMRRALMKEIRS
ncbi:MAG: shikimate dehydrogenase [Verrucomicrobiae bacterium]|nr:shikimate dehydrogenase [Verrucomicrobiae bacterium]